MDKIKYELEHLGYISTVNPDEDKRHYYVTKLNVGKGLTTVDLYEIFTGKVRSLKVWTRQFDSNPFTEGNMISINRIAKKTKQVPGNEINPKTGKKIWVDDPSGAKEFWLEGWSVITDGNEVNEK